MTDVSDTNRDLWCAVIQQAFTDAISTKNMVSALQRAQARAWLTGRSADFAEVCSLAGLDPDAVREHALTAIDRERHPVNEPPTPQRRACRKAALYTDANGVSRSLGDWARLSGINAGTLSSRVVGLGWTIDKATSTPAAKVGNRAPRRPRAPTKGSSGPAPQLITHGDLTMSVPQWAERLGVRRSTLYQRLKHWPVAQALTAPKDSINPRKKGRPASP